AFRRSERLGIERVVLAGTAAKEDLNNRGVVASVLRLRPLSQEIGQTHSAGSQRTKAQKLPTMDVFAVRRKEIQHGKTPRLSERRRNTYSPAKRSCDESPITCPMLHRSGFRVTRTSNRGQCTGSIPRLLRSRNDEVWTGFS